MELVSIMIRQVLAVGTVVMVTAGLMTVAMPGFIPQTDEPIPDYALDYVVAPIRWSVVREDLTYFLFFTFFKCGVDPDCIDMELDEE